MPRITARSAVILLAAISASAINNTIYIISNAETPSLGLDGLTPVGLHRANTCIPSLFAPLNVGKIISCPPDPDSGNCFHTQVTAAPLAASLGLTVDISCGADEETDDDCVTKLMNKFAKNSTKSIVVVWDLLAMDDFFENIDADEPDNDDDDDDDDDDPDESHFDLVTTVQKKIIRSQASQNCSGIDGQAPESLKRAIKRSKKERTKRALQKRNVLSRMVRQRRPE